MIARGSALCVSLHDVAPATEADCRATLDYLDGLGVGPVALLVVPNYHCMGRIDRDEKFCEFLRSRARRGDEIVLHGYVHLDTAGPPRGPIDWFRRRVLTDREGEFAQLDVDDARSRILQSLAVLRSAGWHARGFVAPAWLMSEGTRDALLHVPLEYCATRDHIWPLRDRDPIYAPSLVVSTRSHARRKLSAAWNRTILRRCQRMPLLRAALHPSDIRYPVIAALWRDLLGSLAGRQLLTEADVV